MKNRREFLGDSARLFGILAAFGANLAFGADSSDSKRSLGADFQVSKNTDSKKVTLNAVDSKIRNLDKTLKVSALGLGYDGYDARLWRL